MRSGILEHFLVVDGRADGRDDAFADARDDRRFARAADVAVEIAAHGDPRFDVELNAVLRDALEDRRLDHLRVHRRLQRFEHVAAGQIDRRGALPFQRNLRALRGDHGEHDVLDVAAGQVVRLHLIDRQRQAGLARAHEVGDDDARRNADEAHADQRDDRRAARPPRSCGSTARAGSNRGRATKPMMTDEDDDDRTRNRQPRAFVCSLDAIGSTKMRAPSTRVTANRRVPAGTKSPSVRTSTRCRRSSDAGRTQIRGRDPLRPSRSRNRRWRRSPALAPP